MDNPNEKKIPEVVLGVTLDEEAIQALKEGKETGLIKGFTSEKSGKVFDAYLRMGNYGKVLFRFPKSEAKKGPKKIGKIPTTVGGVELDPEDIEDLKAGRETKLIVGIESKKKGKYYDAYLRWSETKGMLFRFPGMD